MDVDSRRLELLKLEGLGFSQVEIVKELSVKCRRTHKEIVEPAQKLLEQIKYERAKNQKQEFEDFPLLDKAALPSLPESWSWVRVAEIGYINSGQTPKGIERCGETGAVPYYRVQDMNRSGNEKLMFDSEISLNPDEITKLKIHIQDKGTIIFPKRGGAIATNKKRILSKPSAYDLNIMGIRPILFPTEYFYYWISSIDLIKLSDGSNVPQINNKNIKPLLFPLAPVVEQNEIIREIDNRLSVAQDVGNTTEQSLKQANILRQSILKDAFSGRLVPQDPNDEPAEKLLERIKAERIGNRKPKPDNQAELSCYVK